MIQVYTGNGKGKTTAALGLAVRAAGAGLRVYIGQFLKGRHCCEMDSLLKIGNIKIEQFGTTGFIKKRPSEKDAQAARSGVGKIKKIVSCRKYDVVIMDEINVAVRMGLVDEKELLKLIKAVPVCTEVILTGRGASRDILKCADLVSHVRQVKHYFHKGIRARKGIEF